MLSDYSLIIIHLTMLGIQHAMMYTYLSYVHIRYLSLMKASFFSNLLKVLLVRL